MSGLEQAAQAFDIELGNTASPSADSRSDGDSAPIERMFGNAGNLEVDEESPAEAGGDAEDRQKRGERPQRPVAEDPAEEEAEDEDQPEEKSDAEDEEEEDTSDVYRVRVDGEDVEVSLNEALNGYVRQETLHRRLNEIDEVKKAIRSEAVSLLDDRKRYSNKIEELDAAIEQLIGKEPEWDKEFARDPIAARALQKQYDNLNNTRQALKAEKQRVEEENRKQMERDTAEYLQQENARILANNPTWSDPKVRERDIDMMSRTAQNAGFSIEEIRGVTDSRMVTVLLKAAKYDKLVEDRPQPVRRGKQPIKPGAGRAGTAPKVNGAMKQLAKTGKVDDAANVFLGIINPRRK